MISEVKFAAPEPSLFDPRGHRFQLTIGRSLTCGAGCRACSNSDCNLGGGDMSKPGHCLLALVVCAALAIPALTQDARSPTGEKPMLDPQMLADRYVAVWNEKDEARRRDAIAALWVPNGQHYVQGRKAQGYEELEKRIQGSHEKNVRDDGNRFRALPGARHLPGVVTFYWEMLPANADTVLVTGLEFLIINDDGRILVDYQFFPA
jgi:hypothetical protein